MSTTEEMSGVELIAAERRRQVEEEGWTAEHDEEHIDGELCGGAAAYATVAHRQIGSGQFYAESVKPPAQTWRWSHEWWKPSEDPIRNLVKAGALIAAEIDRLQRRAATMPDETVAYPFGCSYCSHRFSTQEEVNEHMRPHLEISGDTIENAEGFCKRWDQKCFICGETPTVNSTGMCGPCTWGESDTYGGNW